MSSHKIATYSRTKTKEVNVNIKPSRNPNKKIDVFDRNEQFTLLVRAIGNMDCPTYLATGDKA